MIRYKIGIDWKEGPWGDLNMKRMKMFFFYLGFTFVDYINIYISSTIFRMMLLRAMSPHWI